MTRLFCALIIVLLLAGCSGGGNGDGINPGSSQSLTGLEPPSFTDSEIVPAVAQIYGLADTLLVSDVPITYQGQRIVVPTTCFRSTCEAYDLSTGASARFDLSVGSTGGDYTAVGEKHGVSLAHGETTLEVADVSMSASGYGGWMRYSFFDAEYGRVNSGELRGAELAVAVSLGNDTGSPPTGSATWTGIMVGATNGSPQPIQGDARVVYSLSNNTIDASFSSIYNLATRRPHTVSYMNWNGVPVRSDGFFHDSISSVNEITGRFYGPGHAEVGGIFQHPTAIGSFGASK